MTKKEIKATIKERINHHRIIKNNYETHLEKAKDEQTIAFYNEAIAMELGKIEGLKDLANCLNIDLSK